MQPRSSASIGHNARHGGTLSAWSSVGQWLLTWALSMVPITVNGHQILGQVVLDLGANEPMIHQRVVDKHKWAVDPNGRSITGIHGESHMMAKTIEALEVTLFPEDCEREAQGCDRMMVMNGDSLPDLLLDNEMMAQLGILVDTVNWTASFLGRPYADAEQRTELPLMLPDRYAHIAAGASGSTADWPASYEAHPQCNGLCCVANFQMAFGVGGGGGRHPKIRFASQHGWQRR